ncbi:MAG TPA: non-homologous end-joining DNA ligase [Thermoanaerobaculia bacterium]|nr:non-homologous end-joining DNA ligase [Thermoanaerobaculia bacterium]
MRVERFGPYRVELTHPDKVLFPDAGLTKRGLVDYYRAVADRILPHLSARPLTQQRFPDGVGAEGFYQKEIPDSFPDWVARCRLELREPKAGETHQTQVVCENLATLALLAQHGCVTPHVWTSRCDRLDRPDQVVFDLDPSGDDFDEVRFAARTLHEALDELGLVAYAKTTGSRGVHVHVPLRREHSFDRVRAFARALAERLAGRHPERLTVEQRKAKRAGRLYLDVARNAWGQTVVPPYAVRARGDAPVALPIPWQSLDDGSVGPRSYRVDNVAATLAGRADPWSGFARRARSLARPEGRLAKLAPRSAR